VFKFSRKPLNPELYRTDLVDLSCGAYASFEGWVRNRNEGRQVHKLEYEAYETLGLKEGERILREVISRTGVERVQCVHRLGELKLGELAVWVGVSSPHRDEAFLACRMIIDEIKERVPIWKKEHYVDGDSGWVNCERCSENHKHAPTFIKIA
jgi:molybdopterin synthase catalytic subunit